MTVPILQTPVGYVERYPAAVEFAETQMSILWPPDEYPTENDVQEVLIDCDEAERHGVLTALKLFTRYELVAGNEYWGNRIAKKYKYACIRRMANMFSAAELNSHAPFYFSLSKHLNLDSEEHQEDYKRFDILVDRLKFVEDCVSSDNDLLSVAVFSMIEGAVLYSSFAYMKSMKANGNNRFKNLVSGLNASVVDENLHAEGGAWLFKQHLKEVQEKDETFDVKGLKSSIYKAAEDIVAHEDEIIALMFERGAPRSITETQLKNFVRSRVDICLQNIGLKKLFKVSHNPVADWFYDGINSVKLHDFFNSSGTDYHRKWSKEKLKNVWRS